MLFLLSCCVKNRYNANGVNACGGKFFLANSSSAEPSMYDSLLIWSKTGYNWNTMTNTYQYHNHPEPRVIVTAVNGQIPAAEQLAAELHLPFIADAAAHPEYEYALVLTPYYLGIQQTSEKKFAPFYIDFLSGKMRYRI